MTTAELIEDLAALRYKAEELEGMAYDASGIGIKNRIYQAALDVQHQVNLALDDIQSLQEDGYED